MHGGAGIRDIPHLRPRKAVCEYDLQKHIQERNIDAGDDDKMQSGISGTTKYGNLSAIS